MESGTERRYPGAESFQDKPLDRSIFYGRDVERDRLLHLVLAERLVLVFGKSGIGKTSLLQAGVFEELRRHDFFPINIRLNPQQTDGRSIRSLVSLTVAEIRHDLQCSGVESNCDIDPVPGTLWEYFSLLQIWSDDDVLLSPVIVFDQFEEVFSYYSSSERELFTEQIADIVQRQTPRSIREKMEMGLLDGALTSAPEVRIIFSMREDYLYELQEMSTRIPGIMQNRLRLRAMTRTQAEQAILRPALLQGSRFRSAPFRYSTAVLKDLLDYLNQGRSRPLLTGASGIQSGQTAPAEEASIDPAQLQILCFHIENLVLERLERQPRGRILEPVTVSVRDLGGKKGMKEILDSYFDRQLRRIGSFRQRRVVKRFLRNLIYENQRVDLPKKKINAKFGIDDRELQRLVEFRLIRKQVRELGTFYELSHDNLIEPVTKLLRTQYRKLFWYAFVCCVLLAIMLTFVVWERYPRNLLAKAERLVQQKDHRQAIRAYEDALATGRAGQSTYLSLADLYLNREDNYSALGVYQRAINRGFRHEGIFHDKLSQVLESLGSLQESELSSDRAYDCYKLELEIGTLSSETYSRLAQKHVERGLINEATGIFTDSLSVRRIEHATIFRALLMALLSKRSQRALDAAASITETALSTARSANRERQSSVFDSSFFREVGRALESACAPGPESSRRTQEALCKKSVTFFEDALKLPGSEPLSFDYRLLLWHVVERQCKLDRLREAEESLDSYWKRRIDAPWQPPREHSCLRAEYNRRGFESIDRFDFREAAKFFSNEIEADPYATRGYNNRAFARIRLGLLDAAEEDLVAIEARGARKAWLLRNKALLNWKRTEDDEAAAADLLLALNQFEKELADVPLSERRSPYFDLTVFMGQISDMTSNRVIEDQVKQDVERIVRKLP